MNETLKAAGHIGAELGAAIAENEMLRGLLEECQPAMVQLSNKHGGELFDDVVQRIRAALSRQAEPECLDCRAYQENEQNPNVVCDECGWKQSEQAEPAPAQDEREAKQCLFVLRSIGSMDAEEISGDDVDLRFEDGEGRDTGCDISIVEYAERSADLIERLLARPAQTEQQPVAWLRASDLERLTQPFVAGCAASLSKKPGDGWVAIYLDPIAQTAPQGKFRMGDLVKKSLPNPTRSRR